MSLDETCLSNGDVYTIPDQQSAHALAQMGSWRGK